jgi:ABC-type transporter Mla subunit MlaD
MQKDKFYYNKVLIGFFLIGSLFYFVLFFDANKIYSGVNYNFLLKDSAGIKKGDSVYLNGYPVGKVINLYLREDYSVNLVVNIDEKIKITTDSAISLLTDSFVSGNKIITIIMGIEEDYFSANDVIYNANLGFNLNSFLDSLIWYLNMKKIDMKQKNVNDSMGAKNNAK